MDDPVMENFKRLKVMTPDERLIYVAQRGTTPSEPKTLSGTYIGGMTDDELIEHFAQVVGKKAGELSADAVAHAHILGSLAGANAGRTMLQIIIARLTEELEEW